MVNCVVSPFFLPAIVTGTVSPSKKPALCAACQRSCERSAKASWSARDTLNSAATFSAVSGIESMPYCCFISGLTKRQPMVVSSTFTLRENALSALAITNGARVMLSTPPAIISSASPDAIVRAHIATASRPEPHRRLMVAPATSVGRPASSAAMRATLRLSSPAPLAQP